VKSAIENLNMLQRPFTSMMKANLDLYILLVKQYIGQNGKHGKLWIGIK